jgi:simple sugar transport system permease protein
MARAAPFKSIPSQLFPLAGILLLFAVNIAFDLAGGRVGLTRPGAFLHIGIADGVPSGAIIDILNYGSGIAILAIGMTLVTASRGVDLSLGSIMAICGAVAVELLNHGTPAWACIAAALAAGLLCGLWNGILISMLDLQPFVATLVLLVCGRGVAQMITLGQTTAFHDPLLEFVGLGRLAWLPLPLPFILALTILSATLFIVRCTRAGLTLESFGDSPVAARFAGVQPRIVQLAIYGFSGMCAAVSGLIAAANIKAADPFNCGRNSELGAIFAAVVGGTALTGGRFSLSGAFIGAFLLQTLTTTMYARDVSADVAPLPQAMVILAVCIAASPKLRQRIRDWRSGTRP